MTMLSRFDRLMLRNQYLILEKLYPEEAEHYAEIREAIENGYEQHYSSCIEGVLDGDDVMTVEECRMVLDTLTVFEQIQDAVRRGVTIPDGQEWASTFWGFDGNNESKFLGYSEYYCRANGGRFKHLNIKNFNSHMPTLNAYARMRAAWEESANKLHLTQADVERILAAATYPR